LYPKFAKRIALPYFTWNHLSLFLLLITIFVTQGCGAEASENDASVASATITTVAIQIPTKSLPTARPAPIITVSVEPLPHAPTLIPTVTVRSTVVATVASAVPVATSTPTLSLLDILSQTILITATNLLPPTAIISYPKPPAVEQPLLGPETSIDAKPPTLSATTLTVVQSDGVLRTAHIPILMYHYLSTPPPGADIYRRDLSVSPELFAAHLDRMQAEGYSTISLYDLVAHLLQGIPLPAKPVILTFDDGYRDNYENAYPLLHERQMTATFFVVIDFINRERPEYLTWDMVREMYGGGMSIEVHGVDHTTLRNRNRADLEFQALRSYETIQDRIGVRPRFLSYPAGEYDAATIEIFRNATYWAGLTTIQGATHSSDNLFELRRVRIRNTTTPDELVRLLEVDW